MKFLLEIRSNGVVVNDDCLATGYRKDQPNSAYIILTTYKVKLGLIGILDARRKSKIRLAMERWI